MAIELLRKLMEMKALFGFMRSPMTMSHWDFESLGSL